MAWEVGDYGNNGVMMIHAIFQYMMSKGVRWKLMNFFLLKLVVNWKLKLGKNVTFEERKKNPVLFQSLSRFLAVNQKVVGTKIVISH